MQMLIVRDFGHTGFRGGALIPSAATRGLFRLVFGPRDTRGRGDDRGLAPRQRQGGEAEPNTKRDHRPKLVL